MSNEIVTKIQDYTTEYTLHKITEEIIENEDIIEQDDAEEEIINPCALYLGCEARRGKMFFKFQDKFFSPV